MGQPKLVKINTLGDQGVGRDALLARFSYDHFAEEFNPHRGEGTRKMIVIEHCPYIVESDYNCTTIDSPEADAEWLPSNAEINFIRQSDGILLIYDVSARPSFDHIEQYYKTMQNWEKPWPKSSSAFSDSAFGVPTILVGNKCDLDREVSTDEGRALARKLNCSFLETSAKTGQNVQETFLSIVMKRREEEAATDNSQRRFSIRRYTIRQNARNGKCSIL